MSREGVLYPFVDLSGWLFSGERKTNHVCCLQARTARDSSQREELPHLRVLIG